MSKDRRLLAVLVIAVLLMASCGRPTPETSEGSVTATTAGDTHATSDEAATSTVAPVPTPAPSGDGLSPDEVATLNSLKQVDDYPLYTMHYFGPYAQGPSSQAGGGGWTTGGLTAAWACSLLAALGNPEDPVYGRNFDWEFSPALLLFTDPPDGYASVSMVDIAYLGFGGDLSQQVAGLPLEERRPLLATPFLPFDGMNEQGLAVGMAAVPPGDMRPDPGKETIDSLGVIREMLDHARTVDEAVAILDRYNIDMEGHVPLHYLVADRTGHAVLVEFYQGKRVLFPNDGPWHQATNFLRAAVGPSTAGQCPRYDLIQQRLGRAKGRLTPAEAMSLLARVAQPHTQWSIVYGLSTGEVRVAMGQKYDDVHALSILR
jgi:Linear amide C-N hydrolases, choloylglycine hydrolase family